MALSDTFHLNKRQYRETIMLLTTAQLLAKWHDKVPRIISRWIKIGAYAISSIVFAGVPLIGVTFNVRQMVILWHKAKIIDSELRRRGQPPPVVTKADMGRGTTLGVAGALIGLGLMQLGEVIMGGEEIVMGGGQAGHAAGEACASAITNTSGLADFGQTLVTGTQMVAADEWATGHGTSHNILDGLSGDGAVTSEKAKQGGEEVIKEKMVDAAEEVPEEAIGSILDKGTEKGYDKAKGSVTGTVTGDETENEHDQKDEEELRAVRRDALGKQGLRPATAMYLAAGITAAVAGVTVAFMV